MYPISHWEINSLWTQLNKIFGWIYTPTGIFNKFSLVAKLVTLSNFANLHKSKMAADGHLENLTFDEIDIEWSVIPLFVGFWGHRIHFWHYFIDLGCGCGDTDCSGTVRYMCHGIGYVRYWRNQTKWWAERMYRGSECTTCILDSSNHITENECLLYWGRFYSYQVNQEVMWKCLPNV